MTNFQTQLTQAAKWLTARTGLPLRARGERGVLTDGSWLPGETPSAGAASFNSTEPTQKAENSSPRPDNSDNRFSVDVPPRLAAIRLQLCTLAHTARAPERQACLSGLMAHCQWLSAYSQTAGFPAVAQVASGLEKLTKAVYERPEQLTETVLGTASEAADLLGKLTAACPEKLGRAEGARVLVVEPEHRTRTKILAGMEAVGISGIGMAGLEAALRVVAENAVDIVVIRAADTDAGLVGLSHDVRRLSRQATASILVLSPKTDSARRHQLIDCGASEVINDACSSSELALKILGHFFGARVSGTQRPTPLSQVALVSARG